MHLIRILTRSVYSTEFLQYSIEPAFNSKLLDRIALNVALYIFLTQHFDSPHLKCDIKPCRILVLHKGSRSVSQ